MFFAKSRLLRSGFRYVGPKQKNAISSISDTSSGSSSSSSSSSEVCSNKLGVLLVYVLYTYYH